MQCTLNKQNYVFGCYNSKGIPPMPVSLSQDQDFNIDASPEDFCFCYIDDNTFHHFQPKAGVPIMTMYTDYEEGGALSVAHDFILMTYSYDFIFQAGVVTELEKLHGDQNSKNQKQIPDSGGYTLNKFEVWTLASQTG